MIGRLRCPTLCSFVTFHCCLPDAGLAFFTQVLFALHKDTDAELNVRWFTAVWYEDTKISGLQTAGAIVRGVFWVLPGVQGVKDLLLWVVALAAPATKVTPVDLSPHLEARRPPPQLNSLAEDVERGDQINR